MSRPVVYLAGPITGHTYDDASDWRSAAERRLRVGGLDTASPLRCKEYLRPVGVLEKNYHDLNVLSGPKGITTRDRNDVMRCDLVLAYMLDAERVSIGTMIELGWADAFRKPIVLVEEKGGLHDHEMASTVAGFQVPTLDEALDIAIAILMPWGG